VETIAAEVGCSQQTVRRRLHRFDVEGIEGLGDRPKAGRPRRLTTEDDSRIIALARSAPPGKLERLSDGSLDVGDEQGDAQWSLDALVRAAKRQECRSSAARSAGFAYARECAGAERTVGAPVLTKTLSQKGSGRQPLHRAPQRFDDHLYR